MLSDMQGLKKFTSFAPLSRSQGKMGSMKTRKPREKKNLSGREAETTPEGMKEEVLSSRTEP